MKGWKHTLAKFACRIYPKNCGQMDLECCWINKTITPFRRDQPGPGEYVGVLKKALLGFHVTELLHSYWQKSKALPYSSSRPSLLPHCLRRCRTPSAHCQRRSRLTLWRCPVRRLYELSQGSGSAGYPSGVKLSTAQRARLTYG